MATAHHDRDIDLLEQMFYGLLVFSCRAAERVHEPDFSVGVSLVHLTRESISDLGTLRRLSNAARALRLKSFHVILALDDIKAR